MHGLQTHTWAEMVFFVKIVLILRELQDCARSFVEVRILKRLRVENGIWDRAKREFFLEAGERNGG